jgi:hypothetical protein
MTTEAAPNNASPANNTPTASNAPPAAWHASYDNDTKGWLQTKGYDKLESVDKVIPELVKGYRGAEQFLGVPADQLIRIPKDGDEKVMSSIYDRLGRPADPKGYDFKLPEGAKPEHADALKGMFHKYGLNPKQAAGVVADLVAMEQAEMTQGNEAAAAKRATEATALKTKWGAAYEKNSSIVEGVAHTFGMSKEQLAALSNTMGPAAAAEMLHKIGVALGEDKFVGGDGSGKFGDVKSPSAAAVEIAQLMQDKDFQQLLQNGNKEANDRWTRLHIAKAGG